MQEFDLYIVGWAEGGAVPPDQRLARVFHMDAVHARQILRSLPRAVKHHVSAEHVERYVIALEQIGAIVEARPSPITPRKIVTVSETHGDVLTLSLPPKSPQSQAPLPEASASETWGDLPPMAAAAATSPDVARPAAWDPLVFDAASLGQGGRPDWLTEPSQQQHSQSPRAASGPRLSMQPTESSPRSMSAKPRPSVPTSGPHAPDPAPKSRRRKRLVLLAALGAALLSVLVAASVGRWVSAAAKESGDALSWSSTPLHQWSNGDRQVVLSLVTELRDAGALSVSVSGVTHSGMVSTASELRVQLPKDDNQRRAINGVIRAFRTRTWGTEPAAVSAADPFGGEPVVLVSLN